MSGSGVLSSSWVSPDSRAESLPAVRQKFHLTPCAKIRDHLAPAPAACSFNLGSSHELEGHRQQPRRDVAVRATEDRPCVARFPLRAAPDDAGRPARVRKATTRYEMQTASNRVRPTPAGQHLAHTGARSDPRSMDT